MNLVTVSPPLSIRPRPAKSKIIVLHATAGSTARSSIDWLRSQGLGYHYIIARDQKDTASTEKADDTTEPTVFACIETKHRGAHAGTTIPVPGTDFTHNQIGVAISLANRQNGEKYTEKQISVLDALIAKVIADEPSITHLTTHAVIQPWNRADPLNVDAKALAKKHGLTFFTPSAADIDKHKPAKTPKPK